MEQGQVPGADPQPKAELSGGRNTGDKQLPDHCVQPRRILQHHGKGIWLAGSLGRQKKAHNLY